MKDCDKINRIQKLIDEQKIILKEREAALRETQIMIEALEKELEQELGE